MPQDATNITYRVWGLPPDISDIDTESILRALFDTDEAETQPTVHSLGLDPYALGHNVEVVATVTFSRTPSELLDGDHWLLRKRVQHQNVLMKLTLTIDTTFIGFTPLNTVKDDEDHMIDCIAISGLSSHPFGSWKQRGGDFMWLRDSSEWQTSGVRVLLYGYDTSLVRSESFQDIDDIGHKLGDFITRIRLSRKGGIDFKPRPIVFIAHSLGGLVVKEAICHLETTDRINAQCIYGLVFFGVPNRGIRISHWLPIVNNQPNENLVRNLAPESQYLRSLHERFCRVFTVPKARVVSVYETLRSKTAKEETPGCGQLTGPTEVLVTRESAMDSCPPGLKHNRISMNRNHADLPKFRGPHDSDYQLLKMYLQDFWREAVGAIQMRFEPKDSSYKWETLQTSHTHPFHWKLEESYMAEPLHPVTKNRPLSPGNHSSNPCASNPVAGGSPSKTIPRNIPLRGPIVSTSSSHEKGNHYNSLDPTDASPQQEYISGYHGSQECTNETQSSRIPSTIPATTDNSTSTSHQISKYHQPFLSREKLDNYFLRSIHTQWIGAGAKQASQPVKSKQKTSNPCLTCNERFDSRLQLFEHLKISKHDVSNMDNGDKLHYAISAGRLEKVTRLLDKGVGTGIRKEYGITPIHLAAVHGYLDITKLLLARGADLHAKTISQTTPIHLAIFRGHTEVLKLLLDHGASIETRDSCGRTALHLAAFNGHVEVMEILLDHAASIEAKDSGGCTVLHLAAFNGHVEVVKMLLDHGVSIEAKDSGGCTALHLAAFNGHVEVAKMLLDHGASIETKDSAGYTVLHNSIYKGHMEVVKMLLRQKASVKATDALGRTPLFFASFHGRSEVLEELLEHPDVDIRSFDNTSHTVLFYAAREGHCAFIQKLLLYRQINPTARDFYGSTPLCVALRNGHADAVSCLYAITRPSMDAVDCFGQSLGWWARKSRNPRIRDLLLSTSTSDADEGAAIPGLGDLSEELATNETPLRTRFWCSSCMIPISDNCSFYECRVCDGGWFHICNECFALGIHCRNDTHSLSPREPHAIAE